ncbi:MAG: hypothetical protein CMN69_12475 [Sphingomonadaceae bacterium]|nr:hypothetical protein [Sphingomonadaceae bacterium]
MRAITLFSTSGKLLVAVILCASFLVDATQASEQTSPYSIELPQFAHLQALEARANDLQTNEAQDAAGRARIIAGWKALQEAASRTLLPDGSVHPLTYIAKLKIASLLYANGEIDAAIAMAEEGVVGSRPYIADYPTQMADSAALLGVLLTQKGEPERAFAMVEATYEEFAQAVAEEPSAGAILAKSNLEHSLSQITLRMGRTQDALDYQKASLDTRERSLGPNHPDTVAAYYNYAQTLRRAGRMEEAEAIARAAVERASAHVDPSHPSYARSFEMLGIVLANSGRPIEATEFLSNALELKRRYEGADTLIFGYGIHNLATILLQRRHYQDVQSLFSEAEEIMSRYQGANSAFPILALAYNGQASLALGEPIEAQRLLEDAHLRLGQDTKDVEALSRIVPDLVRSLKLTDQSAKAFDYAAAYEQRVLESDTTDAFEIAFARLLRVSAMSSGDDAMVAVAANGVLDAIRRSAAVDEAAGLEVRHLSAIDLVFEIAAKRDDPSLMLAAMSLVSGSDIARAASRGAKRLRASDPELAMALSDRKQMADRLEKADRAMLLALARDAKTEALQIELDEARSRYEAAERSIQDRFPAWADTRLQTSPSIFALQASLKEDEAVFAIAPVYYGSYALVVTPQSARAVQFETNRRHLVDLANSLGSTVRVGDFDQAASRALGQALFPPEVRDQLAHTGKLYIHAIGPLASLPFSLVKGWGVDDDATWLTDRFILSYVSAPAPREGKSADNVASDALSLVAFAAPGTNSSRQGESKEVGPAPLQISDYFTRNSIDETAISSLPPLPGTAEEIRTIATAVPWKSKQLFIGPEASEAAIQREEISRADILVLATHGLVAGEIEGIAEPALVLSPGDGPSDDGVLTASEIARLNMRADWVILSSCDSAAGMGGGLPAFSGLAQAFWQAGANDLLVTHWKVRDDIAAYVSTQTVLNYRAGMTKADALHHAIRKLRTESGIEGASSPFAWAPFVLIER